eukprot:TRINITY_DN1915_c0_g2_i6.p1 TRINITY_DN1915_c0_g2~~TRINITY_DN1915_c0_g2_i6.p1  ORF type:complete len:460 (+),score=24.00 TRINITY_DN1915_c0_g2_i6:78-1457(+)
MCRRQPLRRRPAAPSAADAAYVHPLLRRGAHRAGCSETHIMRAEQLMYSNSLAGCPLARPRAGGQEEAPARLRLRGRGGVDIPARRPRAAPPCPPPGARLRRRHRRGLGVASLLVAAEAPPDGTCELLARPSLGDYAAHLVATAGVSAPPGLLGRGVADAAGRAAAARLGGRGAGGSASAGQLRCGRCAGRAIGELVLTPTGIANDAADPDCLPVGCSPQMGAGRSWVGTQTASPSHAQSMHTATATSALRTSRGDELETTELPASEEPEENSSDSESASEQGIEGTGTLSGSSPFAGNPRPASPQRRKGARRQGRWRRAAELAYWTPQVIDFFGGLYAGCFDRPGNKVYCAQCGDSCGLSSCSEQPSACPSKTAGITPRCRWATGATLRAGRCAPPPPTAARRRRQGSRPLRLGRVPVSFVAFQAMCTPPTPVSRCGRAPAPLSAPFCAGPPSTVARL